MKINFNLNGNFKKRFLKFIYNGLLTGMPIITYNPITQNTFNAPLTVEPYSSEAMIVESASFVNTSQGGDTTPPPPPRVHDKNSI